jgi:hypothetical protein
MLILCRATVGPPSDALEHFSGEMDPVHRRECVAAQEESRFHVNGNGL